MLRNFRMGLSFVSSLLVFGHIANAQQEDTSVTVKPYPRSKLPSLQSVVTNTAPLPQKGGLIDYATLDGIKKEKNRSVFMADLQSKIVQTPQAYFEVDVTLRDALEKERRRAGIQEDTTNTPNIAIGVMLLPYKDTSFIEKLCVGIREISSFQRTVGTTTVMVADTLDYKDIGKKGYVEEKNVARRSFKIAVLKDNKEEVSTRLVYMRGDFNDRILYIAHADERNPANPDNGTYGGSNDDAQKSFPVLIEKLVENFYTDDLPGTKLTVKQLSAPIEEAKKTKHPS